MKAPYLTALTVLLSVASIYYLILPFIPSQFRNKVPLLRRRLLQSSGDTSLLSTEFTISNLFEVYCDINTTASAPYITMLVKYNKPNRYFSLGLGKRMAGGDMWVFSITSSGITADDYIGTGDTWPTLDANNDLEVLGYEISSTYSIIKFKRLLRTGDPNDVNIQAGPTDIIWASGTTPSLSYHGSSYGHLNINLAAAVVSSADNGFVANKPVSIANTVASEGTSGGDNDVDATVKVHTIVSLIAWGLIADLGVLSIRLLKGRNLSIRSLSLSSQAVHGILMLAVIIMSLVVTSTVLKEADYAMEGPPRQRFHYIAGLIMLGLMATIVFSGAFHYLNLKYSKRIDCRILKINKWVHVVLGVSLYLLAKANFVTGALLYQNKVLKIVIFTYLGILFALHIMVQYFITHNYKHHNKINPIVNSTAKYLVSSPLLQAINRGDSYEKMLKDFPGITWVILGNSVYDLTDFVHPGGNAVIKACLGREVGRYFFGNYALEGSKISPHKHSALANSLLEQYYVGEITNYESLLVSKTKEVETGSTFNHTWSIAGVKPITETTAQICFKNDTNEINIKNFGTSLSSLGRHFRISAAKSHSKARLYTTAMSLNAANTALRNNILEYFDNIMSMTSQPNQEDASPSIPFKFDQRYLESQDHLPLYIKKYPLSKKGLSNILHDIELHKTKNSFRISGPLGRGLEITPESTGSICIVCAGTGLLPLIDFLNLFLWKTMYDLIKKKAGVEKAEAINVLNLPFDTWFKGMQIKLIGAFASKEDILGLDIIAKLAEISKKYGTDNFSAMIKGYGDEYIQDLQGRFAREFFETEVGVGHARYYICGPPKMNEEIPQFLKTLNVEKEKIFLV